MRDRTERERALRSILGILGAYSEDLLLIGGWVPYLHLTHGRVAVDSPVTSLTAEADLMIPRAMDRADRRPIAEILQLAGFSRRGASGVVWAREPARGGETIEFMQPLRGPGRLRGAARPVADQPGLEALVLDHLVVMESFTEIVVIPASSDGPATRVRLPRLGAFAINKANTFHLRGGADAPMKAGKDLLYLRDIMAAGAKCVRILEEDFFEIRGADDHHFIATRRALAQLEHVAAGYHAPAATILAERDGLAREAALADVRGHLTDLTEVLANAVR